MTDDHLVGVLDERMQHAGGGTVRSLGAPRKYLLTGGIARCGFCNSNLEARPTNSGRRSYVCPATSTGCGRVRISAAGLEEDVAVRVQGRLAQPKVLTALHATVRTAGESGDAFADRIADIEQRMEGLAEDYAEGRIGRTAWHAANRRLEEKRAGLRSAIAHAARIGVLPEFTGPEDLADWWGNRSTARNRHDLVATLLESIVIGPATRPGARTFDPDRVTYHWKHVDGFENDTA